MENYSFINVTEVDLSNKSKSFAWVTFKSRLTTWFVIMMLLAGIASVCTLALAITNSSSKKLRSGSGVYMVNLSAMIFIQCSIAVPFSFYTIFEQSQVTAQLCQKAGFIFMWFYNAVDWADFMLALNRFTAVSLPYFYPKIVRSASVIMLVSASWIVPLIIAILPLSGVPVFGTYKPTKPWNGCGLVPGSVVPIVSAAGIYFPIVATAILYLITLSVIYRKWWKKHNVKVALNNDETFIRRKSFWTKRYRNVAMLFLSYVFYTVFLFVQPMTVTFHSKTYWSSPVLQLVVRGLAVVGYLFIFVSYAFLS